MKKVVIIGATGNTGAYLTEDLVRNLPGHEYEVFAAGRRDTDFFQQYGIGYACVDMADAATLSTLPQEDVFAVILLAGVLPAYMNGYKPSLYIDVNSRGALNVLEYCRKVGADRILYAQTISDVLGSVTPDSPIIRPYDNRNIIMAGDHTVYALSKCFAVDLIRHYAAEYGIKDFVFRLPTVYAYTPDKTYNVNGIRRTLGYRLLMDKAMDGEELEIWGDPTRAKDVVSVKDFCQLLRKAVLAKDVDGGCFNVGTGIGTTTEEWIRGIAAVFNPEGRDSSIVYRPDKPSGPSYIMDISNCRELLGYKPEYDFITFLEDFKYEMSANRFAGLRGAS
ncbi:NAD-dependent epimerase/dehydratase family protein [Paraeggerthella hongkongensis]|uniref:NAD(P)-dependent oxidoreductase n=1 Tax=Paraeggerthella hongkongensis TaxID=230658 RepID=A0A3N0BE80_9ACTN|nr:NAD(P)-dependent oxidoreductase [Paraeggerthella hongkongensis]RNL45774.1 NAD(P)-dependent oxidoreductase [Paraeggerthella hongkongensis]